MAGVLAHFAEDVEFTSPRVPAILGRTSVTGKSELADYWTRGMAAIQSIRFDLDHVIVDGNRLAIVYTSEINGKRMRSVEFLRFNDAGLVCQGEAMHGVVYSDPTRMRVTFALFLLPCVCFADAPWTVVRGSANADPSVSHGGAVSERLDGNGTGDACALSSPVALTIGKHYELSGWVRTEGLRVRDLGRSPIASGATIAMASMPFDVHSESAGGNTEWRRLRLRFVATRATDAIQLSVGLGGAFSGKAWFAGVAVNEASSEGGWPSSEAVQTFGPAYRYPIGGWIYLHIEGAPYERGYQHGHLMWREIVEYMDRSAARLDSKSKDRAWDTGRTMAKALFQRGFDKEMLEEMRGIADGASDAGARWNGRRVDLTDIVVANTVEELGDINDAMTVTPDGLEGVQLKTPSYTAPDHCSSFIATGPATRDGRW